MIEARYWFLFAMALIWLVFATVQDIKKREVANWLNYSLLGFALAYRAFYSILNNDYWFFAYGVMGIVLFAIVANIMYYSRVFGGGDARLLIALGGILPFESVNGVAIEGLLFIFVLFLIGAIYSLIYGAFIVGKNWRVFRKNFMKEMKIIWVIYIIAVILIILLKYISFSLEIFYYCSGIVILLPIIYVYLRALDKCMIKFVNPKDLQEGDWIEEDIKIKGGWIRKSVHGLSIRDIKMLRRAGKKVEIKEGIAFVPSFIVGFVIVLWIYYNYSSIGEYVLSLIGI